MASGQATPPHKPTYGVKLSTDQIGDIVSKAAPGHQVASVERLEQGKSFNNRIYFVNTKCDSATSEAAAIGPLVLKVAGHYFGSTKIQNEVGCLLLLEKYCPSVPMPKVVAWSENGRTMSNIHGQTFAGTKAAPDDEPEPAFETFVSNHAWILTTRLPGRIMTARDLEGDNGKAVLQQLAKHVATWRAQVPATKHIGSLRFENVAIDSSNKLGKLGGDAYAFSIGGLTLNHYYDPRSLTSTAEYYGVLANDKLRHLRDNSFLSYHRKRIEAPVQQLIDALPAMLSLEDGQDTPAVFTHLDIAPRNILIDKDDASKITGIVDVEFAGILPLEEEFINQQIRQPTDWPAHHYETLLRNLEAAGCKTLRQADSDSNDLSAIQKRYQMLCVLVKVTENIAPWWIQPGSMTDEETVTSMNKSATIVEEGIRALNEMI